jgi:endonuclease-3 related protein
MREPGPKEPDDLGRRLRDIYARLFDAFGPQSWWPGETAFEVMVGAVLTQNTAWANVEKAIGRLKEEGLLTPRALDRLRPEELADRIRPAGYYNLKADRLKNLVRLVMDRAAGDEHRLLAQPTDVLRAALLEVKGVGPETADSILLYAAGRPVFVIDAYTRRTLLRHGLARESDGYEDLKTLFMDHLPADPGLFNEYHALLVSLGKRRCRRQNPRCDGCPLEGLPHAVN